MMKGHAHYGPKTRSPLTRVCPKCDARVGERCWNLKSTTYPVPAKKCHKER